jgi:hypothetical protein
MATYHTTEGKDRPAFSAEAEDKKREKHLSGPSRNGGCRESVPLPLAIGIAAAACLPRSRREEELLGQTSDRVKQAVRDTASEQAETAIISASRGTDADREAEKKFERKVSASAENG